MWNIDEIELITSKISSYLRDKDERLFYDLYSSSCPKNLQHDNLLDIPGENIFLSKANLSEQLFIYLLLKRWSYSELINQDFFDKRQIILNMANGMDFYLSEIYKISNEIIEIEYETTKKIIQLNKEMNLKLSEEFILAKFEQYKAFYGLVGILKKKWIRTPLILKEDLTESKNELLHRVKSHCF